MTIDRHPFAGTPTQFVTPLCMRFFKFGTIIPAAFILASLLHLPTVANPVAMNLISIVWPIWPVVADNYQAMKDKGYDVLASNYVLFVCVTILFFLLMLIHACRQYFRSERAIERFQSIPDSIVVLVGVVGYPVISRFDRVVFDFKSLGDFYVGPSGLFFIREYLLITSVFVCVAVFLLSVIFLLGKNARRRRSTPPSPP